MCASGGRVTRSHVFGLLAFAVASPATPQGEPDPLQVWGEEYVQVRPGKSIEIRVHATISEGYRIVASSARHPNLTPLALKLEPANDLAVGLPAYPEPTPALLGGRSVSSLAEELEIAVPISVLPRAKEGERLLRGTLRYQACDEKRCRPPASAPVSVSVYVQADRKD
jgi:hypothetical protein